MSPPPLRPPSCGSAALKLLLSATDFSLGRVGFVAQGECSERRRYPRREFSGSVRISTIDPEIDSVTGRPFFRTAQEACLDVSRGGLRLHSDEELVPGRRLLLEVDLPGGSSLEAIGRVAWSRVETDHHNRRWVGLGVEFIGRNRSQVARLESFLNGGGPPGETTRPRG